MKLTLARSIDCTAERCRVQPLDADDPIDAPLAPRMIEGGVRIRPGMIAALDRDTTPPMIRYRFETRPVEALAGDRLTILGREHRFVDLRPAADRATPIRVGTRRPSASRPEARRSKSTTRWLMADRATRSSWKQSFRASRRSIKARLAPSR